LIHEKNPTSKISCQCPFKLMTFNIQSIAAKFDEFKDLISSLATSGCSPEIIALQEIWSVPDPSFYTLKGYQSPLFSLRKNGQGGGVGLYVKNGLAFSTNKTCSIFIDKLYESHLINLSMPNGKKVLVGSIYRPNSNYSNLSHSEQFSQFELLLNTLSSIDPLSPSIILGDFNLDVLKYGSNSQVTTYIDSLFTSGFLQTVSRPTRCTGQSAL
jgi:exonuclease III